MSNQNFTNQNFERAESRDSQGEETRKRGGAASEAFSRASDMARDAGERASDMARDAGEKAKRAAADTTSTTDSVMGLLNDQLGAGAETAGRFASSMRLAADDLDRENPMLARLVRGVAHNVDNYADNLEGKTVEQLAKNASDLTRRQPALVFGAAAIAGFFAFRVFKNAQSISSPPIQPANHHPADDSNG
jgi:hypothetical protein